MTKIRTLMAGAVAALVLGVSSNIDTLDSQSTVVATNDNTVIMYLDGEYVAFTPIESSENAFIFGFFNWLFNIGSSESETETEMQNEEVESRSYLWVDNA